MHVTWRNLPNASRKLPIIKIITISLIEIINSDLNEYAVFNCLLKIGFCFVFLLFVLFFYDKSADITIAEYPNGY